MEMHRKTNIMHKQLLYNEKLNKTFIWQVQHVDFGNCETVDAEDLRSGVILQEVPVQCQRCELDGITPLTSDGKWPYHTLVHMHDETVGTSCSFDIQARNVL